MTEAQTIANLLAEKERMVLAMASLMAEKHAQAAEARLWFEKAQEWRQELWKLDQYAKLMQEGLHMISAMPLLPVDQNFENLLRARVISRKVLRGEALCSNPPT